MNVFLLLQWLQSSVSQRVVSLIYSVLFCLFLQISSCCISSAWIQCHKIRKAPYVYVSAAALQHRLSPHSTFPTLLGKSLISALHAIPATPAWNLHDYLFSACLSTHNTPEKNESAMFFSHSCPLWSLFAATAAITQHNTTQHNKDPNWAFFLGNKMYGKQTDIFTEQCEKSKCGLEFGGLQHFLNTTYDLAPPVPACSDNEKSYQ